MMTSFVAIFYWKRFHFNYKCKNFTKIAIYYTKLNIKIELYNKISYTAGKNSERRQNLLIDRLSDCIADFYVNKNIISLEEKSVYKFGISMIFNDIVTITPYVPSNDDENVLQSSGNIIAPLAVDYVDNEHFNILPNGDQAILEGGVVYDNYRAMGYRGGYYYAPDTFGYLQRRNDGVLRTEYANRFSFSAGTTIGTAVGIIVAAVTSAGWSLAIGVASALVGAVVDVVTYDWSVKFEKRTYNWLYRVRLNSNTGRIIYNTYRTKDYWLAYNEATGAAEFDYAGSRYDDGFLLSNFELIKAAIDSYLEANLK